MYYDLALQFDVDARRCDLALDAGYDLAIDTTSITPVLLSLGLDRRAGADDELPSGVSDWHTATMLERRGAAGDALSRQGELTGSRDWLLDRAKQTETTRQLCEYWTREALAWAEGITGTPAEIEVWWAADGVLARRVTIDGATVTLTRQVA